MSVLSRGLIIAAFLLLASCRAGPIYNVVDAPFPDPVAASSISMEDYKKAIIRAGTKRGWTFEEVAPGHLIGSVAVRNKHFAKVDLTFDTRTFSITYNSSSNLNYNADRKEIHPNYSKWVQNLEQDIRREITLLGAS